MTRAKKLAFLLSGLTAASLMAASGRFTGQQPPKPAAAPAAPASPADTGYSIGFDLGKDIRANLARDGVTVSPDDVIRGFSDGLRGQNAAVAEAQMTRILTELQKAVDERQVKERLKNDPVFRAEAEQADKASKAFMEKFVNMKGVKVLPSGIAYQVVKSGTGESAKGVPSVIVNFQSYLSSGQPVRQGREMQVNVEQLLPGAAEVLANMRAGDRWYVAVPPALAYGERGNPPNIGPNEAIAIDVEVLEVKK